MYNIRYTMFGSSMFGPIGQAARTGPHNPDRSDNQDIKYRNTMRMLNRVRKSDFYCKINEDEQNRYRQTLYRIQNGGTAPVQQPNFLDLVGMIMGGGGGILNLTGDVSLPLTTSAYNSLIEKKYSEIKNSTEYSVSNCTICMSEFENDETVKILPCKHYFHPACIQEWLTIHNHTCPVCRADCGEHRPTF